MTDHQLMILIADSIVSSGKLDRMQVPAPHKDGIEWAVHLAQQRIIKFKSIIHAKGY